MPLQKAKVAEQQIHFATPGCSSNAVSLPDATKTNRRKSDLYSTSSIKNTTPQISSNCKYKVTASSLCFNNFANFGLGDCNNEDTVKTYYGNSDDDYEVKSVIDDENIEDEDECDLEDEDSNCLICGHVQTLANAKQAALSFQWKIRGDEDAQSDKLSSNSNSCVDVHLLHVFVLRVLLKFPKEEFSKIFQRTFGVSNPADWFTLCGRCVKAAHKAYCLQVRIRQLEKKFKECQEKFLSQVKASTGHIVSNDELSNTNIFTVREHILGFYSGKIHSDTTFKCEPEQSKSGENHNHRSEPLAPPTQNVSEYFEVSLPSPEATISPVLMPPNCLKVLINKKKRRRRRKLGPPKRIRNTNPLLQPQRAAAGAAKLKKLTMKKNQDELIAKHTESLTPTTFRCKLCPQFDTVFQARTGIAHHFAMIHQSMWESVTPYEQCDQCGKSFPAGYSMRQHIQKHHRASRAHVCHLCGNGFVTESTLHFHMKKHDAGKFTKPEKQTVCYFCGMKFKHSSGLSRHIKRFHRQSDNGSKEQSKGREGITSQRNCKHCDVVCANLHELQHHIKSVHPELLKYKCEECDAAYISKQGLQVHVNSVHRQTKLKCKNCSKLLSVNGMHHHVKFYCRGFLNQNL